MSIKIKEVLGKDDLKRFIMFQKDLYKKDENFVFEPIKHQTRFLSIENPFFEHSEARYFTASLNNKVVGRIAYIHNSTHNKTFNEKTGFFGFFESIENFKVAKELLDQIVKLHFENGMIKIIGPTNFTTNDSCGLLISGFDKPSVIMMPYNKAYYQDFLSQYGFAKEIDLLSYHINDAGLKSPHFISLYEKVSKKAKATGIKIRPINYRNLNSEIPSFCGVYNESNRANWGFVPLSLKEFYYMANQFKQFVPEDFILVAEHDHHIIGYIVALPDLNQVFCHLRSGKLFPFGFLKVMRKKKYISNSRILILGVLDSYRKQGIDILMYKKIQEQLAEKRIFEGEACYVLENNFTMNKILNKIGGTVRKKYRIFQLTINTS